jgi:putative membrane protein
VKSFGKMLVEDHQKADQKVVELAAKYNVVLPGAMPLPDKSKSAGGEMPTTGEAPPPVTLDAEGKKIAAKFRVLRGTKFDREFATKMAEGHQKALDLIKGARDKIGNDDFKSVLGDIQASVENHLEHAKKLQAGLGAKAAVPAEEPTRAGRRPPPTP